MLVAQRIALAGKMGSGKTELAGYLNRVHGYRLLSTSQLCRQISRLMFADETRAHLNQLGDTLRRIDENIWVQALLLGAPEQEPVVLDSVRYASEASFLRSRGFQIWRVTVSEPLRQKRLLTRPERASDTDEARHASEIDLDHYAYDFVFDSTGMRFDEADRRLNRS